MPRIGVDKTKRGNTLVDLEQLRKNIEKVTDHMTQNRLEEMAGIKIGGLSRIYNGTDALTVDHLIKLAAACNCSIDFLLGTESNKELKKEPVKESTVYDFVKAINVANTAGAVLITDDRWNFDDKVTGKSVEISSKCIRILDYDLNDAVSLALFSNRMVQYSDKYGSRILESFYEELKKENEPIRRACADDWIKNGFKEIK